MAVSFSTRLQPYLQWTSKGLRYLATDPHFVYRQLRTRLYYRRLARLHPERGFPLVRVLFMLTGDCNLDCEMCNAPRANQNLLGEDIRRWRADRMTLDDYRRVLDDLQAWRSDITLTGGEPLIHREWWRIARAAKERGLKVDLQTNGVFLDRFLEPVLENVDVLNLSVDGPADLHDQIRGREGSFDKIMANARLVEEGRKRRGGRTPMINVVPTITESNQDRLLETADAIFAHLPGAYVGFQHLLYVAPEGFARYQKEVGNDRQLRFWEPSVGRPAMDGERIADQIARLQAKYPDQVDFIPQLPRQQIVQWYDEPERLVDKYAGGCLSPWLEIDICPDGDARICIDKPLGNVREIPLRALWESEPVQALRREIREKGPFQICRACCNLYKY